MSAGDPLLEVEGLEKHYPITEGLLRREVGRVRAVDGISFTVTRGETFGLIGESGCGKSTAVTTLLGLETPTGGTVRFDGEPIDRHDAEDRTEFRRRAQLVLQNPTSSFDPRMTIGESVAEPLRIHGYRDRSARRAVVEDLLERVGLSSEAADRYPHELSGGQKQRAAIARALVLNPDLLIADEPVSALDVSVKAEILALLEDLQAAHDLTVLIVSHDMGVIREVCDRAAVMYAGELVEVGPTEALFEAPKHPYTTALVDAIPTPDPAAASRSVDLRGEVPDPSDPPAGCRFHPRCPEVIPPTDFEADRATFRRVMAFRGAIAADAIDPDTLRERSEDGIVAALRAEFDLPETLPDPDRTAALETALSAVAASDTDRALAAIDAAFQTPCVDRTPEFATVEPDRRVACHLHPADGG